MGIKGRKLMTKPANTNKTGYVRKNIKEVSGSIMEW